MSSHSRGDDASCSLDGIKRILRSLITSQQSRMTVTQLARDFQLTEDRPIPFVELGFPNLRTMLASMSDAFVCHEMFDGSVAVFNIESECSSHISRLVRTQKQSQSKKNFHQQQPPPSNRVQFQWNNHIQRRPPHFQPQQQQQQQQPQQQHRRPAQQHYVAPSSYRPPQPLSMYANLPILITPQQQQANNNPLPVRQPTPDAMQTKPPLLQSFWHPAWQAQRLQLQQHQQQQSLLQQSHNGLLQRPFQTNAAGSKPSPQPPKTATANVAANRVAIVQNLVRPAVAVAPVTSERRNWPPAEVITISSDSENDVVVVDEPQRQSPAAFVAKPFVTPATKVSALVNAFAKSMSLADKQIVPPPLDSPKGSLSSVTSSSSGVSSKNAAPELASEPTEPSEPALPDLRDDDPLFFSDLPDTVAKCGDDIPAGDWPSELQPNATIRLFVTEVNNPTKFWFHLQSDGHPLDRLMYRIENFYNGSTRDPIAMRANNVIAGLLCAARFMGMWHRARIVERLEGGQKARVFFFDYGTTDVLPTAELCYLLRTFAELPAQAYRGAVDGLRPTEHRWTRDSCYTFLELVADVMLYGSVTHVDVANRIVRLVLVNTTRSETVDVVIHRVLLQRQLALPSSLDVVVGQPVRHFSEMYPTFEMLETGVFPSFREVGQMLSRGIDCDAVLYENFAALAIRRRPQLSSSVVRNNDSDDKNDDGGDNDGRQKRPPPIRLHRTNPFAMDVLLSSDADAFELCE